MPRSYFTHRAHKSEYALLYNIIILRNNTYKYTEKIYSANANKRRRFFFFFSFKIYLFIRVLWHARVVVLRLERRLSRTKQLFTVAAAHQIFLKVFLNDKTICSFLFFLIKFKTYIVYGNTNTVLRQGIFRMRFLGFPENKQTFFFFFRNKKIKKAFETFNLTNTDKKFVVT